jgi:hypothetical protein
VVCPILNACTGLERDLYYKSGTSGGFKTAFRCRIIKSEIRKENAVYEKEELFTHFVFVWYMQPGYP